MKSFLKRSLYITLVMFIAAYSAVFIAGVSQEGEPQEPQQSEVYIPAGDFLSAAGCAPGESLTITQRDINGAVIGVRIGGKAFTYIELKRIFDLPWDRFDISVDDGAVVFKGIY